MMNICGPQGLVPALVMSATEAAYVLNGTKRLHSVACQPDGRVRGVRIAIVAAERHANQHEALVCAFAHEAYRAAGQPLPTVTIAEVEALAGRVVATARVGRFLTAGELGGHLQEAWFAGKYGWVLCDVRPVRPVPSPASTLVLRGLGWLSGELVAQLVEVR